MGSERDGKVDVRIVIIGAGPGGMCAVKELTQAGFTDITVLEKCGGVGGTWYINRYPGCACDVQSYLYSFSWEIKNDWSRPYPPQPEILEYLQGIAEKYGILPHCRFHTEVTRARWDDGSSTWSVSTSAGETIEADVLISAMGMFKEPSTPGIAGIDEFEGTMFHSAKWDEGHDLTGERVAVIGSAASAVQLVPEIAKIAGQVHMFQRTANWVLPKLDTPHTSEDLERFRSDPGILDAMRAEIHRLMDEGMTFGDPAVLAQREALGLAAIDVVEDPEVRAKLRPDHPFGCKRPLFSNVYYPAFNRDNLELVTDPIERITPKGVRTADGVERTVDTIVLATGFSTTRYVSVIDVVGPGGRLIADSWEDGAQAYLGIETAGFPNLFMIYGPNTNNGSILTMIESQVSHIVRQVSRLAAENLAWIDVRAEVQESYNDEVQEAIRGVKVWQADCNGYYRSPTGRIVTQWPYSMTEYNRRAAVPDPEAFEVGART